MMTSTTSIVEDAIEHKGEKESNLRTFKMSASEQAWVSRAEPLIEEFAAGLEPEETEDWYLECAELLCNLAHAYYIECKSSRMEPCYEEYESRVMQTLIIKICCADQLAAAMDAFRCKGREFR
jgi:hypothetical protein